MQVPAEAMKADFIEMPEAAEKTLSKDSNAVTLHFPPEAVAGLAKLGEDLETAEESRIADSHRFAERYIKTSEMRISFYEKLILLSGGSFALSLTFLSSLHRATLKPLTSMRALECAWILLLVSIVLSWLHNLYSSTAVEQLMEANASLVGSTHIKRISKMLIRTATLFGVAEPSPVGLTDGAKKLAEHLQSVVKEITDKGTKFGEATTRMRRVAGGFGFFALLSVLVAFILLVVFAVKNAALL